MLFTKIKVLRSHGRQVIPDLRSVVLPQTFRGRPEIRTGLSGDIAEELKVLCPTGAIAARPLSIDLGRCVFCGECAYRAPEHIRFTNDYKTATTCRDALVVKEGDTLPVQFHREKVRPEIFPLFKKSLKLRQVSAGGDASNEMELNAAGNVNFDMGRYGVEFVASPRHADGVVITGPITENMSVPLKLCFDAIPEPRLVILAGTDAISGGAFEGSGAVRRTFLDRHPVDLYLPGHPIHPMTFIYGILSLIHGDECRL